MINLVGILTTDLVLAQVNVRPDFGEEHIVENMSIRPGALANMIYPLAQLGVKPNVISSLGKEDFGEKIYQEILPLIVDNIVRTDAPTALSVSVVNGEGSRYFVTYAGNSSEFTKNIVEKATHFEQAKATMIYGYFLIPNFGVAGAIDCLKKAHAKRQMTFFDANSSIDGWSDKIRNEIYSLLPEIDYFMPNDEELLNLTGLFSIEASVKLLFEKGAATIVVKQGSKGTTAYNKNTTIHHPGFPVKAYDTTGAGDSFNAGFMYSLLHGNDLEKSLAFGNSVASYVVARKENRYPTLSQVELRMQSIPSN